MEEAKDKFIKRLREARGEEDKLEILWEAIVAFQMFPFYTVKNCSFTYSVKGNEMKISRKEKTITRSTVKLALRHALELGVVNGPKKLGVFGASYLYPIFLFFGIIDEKQT